MESEDLNGWQQQAVHGSCSGQSSAHRSSCTSGGISAGSWAHLPQRPAGIQEQLRLASLHLLPEVGGECKIMW